MHHIIRSTGPLLDEKGHLRGIGYANNLTLDYKRKDIRVNSIKIKEWDYYLIHNDEYAIAITVADNGYMGIDSISLLDFRTLEQHTVSKIKPFTMGKRNMPETTTRGSVSVNGKGYSIEFDNPGPLESGITKRRISFNMQDFKDENPIQGEILLTQKPGDSIVMATPFEESQKYFYYNQKINCIRAEGVVKYGSKEYIFSPEDSFAVLDWGRGVWPYRNTWYWGSLSTKVKGKEFGFNIGYGFGKNPATENAVFYDGKLHKLSKVNFNIPVRAVKVVERDSINPVETTVKKAYTESYMEHWHMTSDDNRFNMLFVPLMNREYFADFSFLATEQHQVFGSFTGSVVLDDGSVIDIVNKLGFAEKVKNSW